MIKKNKNNKGLTLIEILISIIITSVMIMAMYTSYNVVSGAYQQVSDKAKISGSSRDLVRSRGLGDVYKRQAWGICVITKLINFKSSNLSTTT